MPIVSVSDSHDLSRLLEKAGVRPGPVWIKVNWTSPHRGMYTEAPVLDGFLKVLSRPVLVTESYTVARYEGAIADLPEDEDAYMEVMRRADRAFQRRTGMKDVLDTATGVGYFNVTEAVHRGDTAPEGAVREAVSARYGEDAVGFPELYGQVPRALWEARDRVTLLNLARMKVPARDSGDWSMAMKNMFGMIALPDRRYYHREDLSGAILSINVIYRSLFNVVDLVEGLNSVVVYDDDGDHRAPWGRYSLREGENLAAWGGDPVSLELEVASHFGIDLSGRDLIVRARGIL